MDPLRLTGTRPGKVQETPRTVSRIASREWHGCSLMGFRVLHNTDRAGERVNDDPRNMVMPIAVQICESGHAPNMGTASF